MSWRLATDRTREVLNAEWFTTTRQAQVVIDGWLKQYNHIRPHHALGMHAPVPETIAQPRSLVFSAASPLTKRPGMPLSWHARFESGSAALCRG